MRFGVGEGKLGQALFVSVLLYFMGWLGQFCLILTDLFMKASQLHCFTVEKPLVFQCSCNHLAASMHQISLIRSTSATSATTEIG